MAKKWPEKVVQRSFIKEHSFVYRLQLGICMFLSIISEASKSLFIEILLISCTKQANLKYATLYYIGLFFSVPNAAYPPMHLSRRTAAMLQPPLLKTTSWCEKSFCSSCHFSFVFRFSGGDVKQPKNKGNQSRYIFQCAGRQVSFPTFFHLKLHTILYVCSSLA